MFDFTRNGASWGLKAVDLTENENLHVDRKFRNFSTMFKSCKIIVKPCIFLRQILMENS